MCVARVLMMDIDLKKFVTVRNFYIFFFFFFNDTATTEIYTLSLHDALPICTGARTSARCPARSCRGCGTRARRTPCSDRKSTRLNSSHLVISYAVFCLKKKKLTIHLSPIIATQTLILPRHESKRQ